MTRAVEFYFDVGSPAAYLAWTQLPKIVQQAGCEIEYRPFLLGGVFQATGNRSPMDVPAKARYMIEDLERFARRYGVPFRHNPHFPINTLMLMRGAVAAQFEGVFEPYFRAAYHHMWEEPKKMDDPEIFRNAFVSSGVDIDRLVARAQQDDVKKRLIDLTNDAVGRGAFGSPTFFVGKEMFFGKDQIRDVEESIVEQIRQPVPKTA
jgi:2-hydroxychromene-2-carboxylate isomerase